MNYDPGKILEIASKIPNMPQLAGNIKSGMIVKCGPEGENCRCLLTPEDQKIIKEMESTPVAKEVNLKVVAIIQQHIVIGGVADDMMSYLFVSDEYVPYQFDSESVFFYARCFMKNYPDQTDDYGAVGVKEDTKGKLIRVW